MSKRRTLPRFFAIFLVISMAFSFTTGALADNELTITGNVPSIAANIGEPANNSSPVPSGATVTVTGDVQNVVASSEDGITYSGGTPSSVPAGTTDVEFTGSVTGSTGTEAVKAKDDLTIKVDGDATGGSYGVNAHGGASVTVDGNAKGTEAYSNGVYASGAGTEVTVGKDATGVEVGAAATSGASVTVSGNAVGTGSESYFGVYASGTDTEVTVGGNVTGASKGAHAQDNAKITVTGNATGGNLGVYAESGANVKVSGDANGTGTYGYGVSASGADTEITVGGDATGGLLGAAALDGATVIVTGNISGGQAGIAVDSGNTVVAEGSVSGGCPIVLYSEGKPTSEFSISDFSDNKIIVGSFNSENPDISFFNGTQSAGLSRTDYETFLKEQIYYIVSGDASVSGTAEETVGEKTYNVAQEGTELTIAKPDDGYEIKIDGNCFSTLEPQADGSYKLTVAGGGGLKFIVTLISQGDGGNAYYAVSVQEVSYDPSFGYVFATFDQDSYTAEAGKPLNISLNVTAGSGAVAEKINSVVVTVDGTQVPAEFFKLIMGEKGKLDLELLEEYLKTLEAGSHALSVQFGIYSYDVDFTI